MHVLQRKLLVLILMAAFVGIPAACPAGTASLPYSDNFESFAVGTTFTTSSSTWALNSAPGVTWAKIEAEPSGNKYVRFHDDNGSVTTNNHLYRRFDPVVSGRLVAQFDVYLPQTTAGFGVRLCSGTPLTSGQNWCSGLIWEGRIAYAPGASAGTLSSQTDSVPTYKVTPLSRQYAASAWYTVRVTGNLDSKVYKLFFGPKGDEIIEITPTGGLTFSNTASGHTVTQINYLDFFSSNRNGDDPGDLFVDNVSIYSEAETTVSSPTIAQARLLDRGTKVSLLDKIVVAGSLANVFYIEDDTPGAERAAGIRVRYAGSSIPEGARIDVVGRITQTAEGTLSDHNGEREIAATQVTIRSTGNVLPKPLHMKCSDVGGGWYGPMELMSAGYEPAIKGVWPSNAWGNVGVTSYVPADNRRYPLNNTGLLVTVTGKVSDYTTYDAGVYDFFVDDGSLTNDGWFSTALYTDEAFHPRGLRVRIADPSLLGAVAPLNYGDVVRVMGISGVVPCDYLGRPSVKNVRVIRPRKPEDIQVIQRQERYVKFDSQGNCLVGGHYFFPIGIFTYYWDSLTRPEIVSQGFNVVTSSISGGITPAHLSQLQSDGIMVLPYMADMEYYDAWLAVKDHPAILAWYITDEPEAAGGVPRRTVAEQRADYERLRAADPGHPIGTAHYLWNAIYDYRFAEDFTKSDVYPIHKAPIVNVAIHIDRVHQVHGYDYPVWPFIQCFASVNEGYDIPSRADERCMVYLALAHRSKGVFFFSYYPSLTETWAEVKQLVTEMKQLAPFYCMPSSEPALGNDNGNMHTRLILMGGSGLIITVNPTGEAQTATFTIPSPAPTSLTLPFEGGATVPVTGGSFTASFDPLGVHIYQWGPTPTIP